MSSRLRKDAEKEWIFPSSMMSEDMYAMQQAVSSVGFEHGICNWQMIFVTDYLCKKLILGNDSLQKAEDMLAVFCVNPQSWDRSYPNLWDRADFETKSHYMDDMLEIGRGNKTLQRDQAIRNVGIAMGVLLAKSQDLGYCVDPVYDFDCDVVVREIELPEPYEVNAVLRLGRGKVQRQSLETQQRKNFFLPLGEVCVSQGVFKPVIVD